MKRFLAMLIAAATLTFGGMANAEELAPFDLNKATVEQLMAIPEPTSLRTSRPLSRPPRRLLSSFLMTS